MEKWKDLLGQEINEGDTIAYATRVGNSAYMNVATVIGYKNDKLHVQKTLEGTYFKPVNFKPSYLGDNDKIIVITKQVGEVNVN